MSFLDTLKNLGLWQGQQPQAAQPNPYGLDPQMMQMARSQALGNIGGQIMAMSAQMTPDQRARMMAGADWTGGYQNSLYNAAQMQLMSDAQRRRKLEMERAEDARTSIAEMIKKTPPGRLRDAAMYFFQAGDYGKAGELLFKQERRLTPFGTYETVDAFGNPIGSSGSPMPQAGAPQSTGPVPAAAGGVPAPGPSPIPVPDGGASVMPQPDPEIDQLTLNWRRLTGDPSLTPAEAKQISMAAVAENDPNAGMKVYRELVKNRMDIKDKDRQATKDKADMANTIVDDRRAQMVEPERVVSFAQSIEDVLASGNPTSMRALATQVLFAKVLDPGSAFMTGEAELQQAAASWTQRMDNWLRNSTEGSPVPPQLVLEMRDIARKLGRKALGKLETIDKEAKTRASSFGLTDQMLGNPFQLRWNRFADPAVSESGTGVREPSAQAYLDKYGDE